MQMSNKVRISRHQDESVHILNIFDQKLFAEVSTHTKYSKRRSCIHNKKFEEMEDIK